VTDQLPPAEPGSTDPAADSAAAADEIIINRSPLAAGVPVLLLPVRIETRFVPQPAVTVKGQASGPRLLVRIYPDTISVSSFEPELTADEVAAGTAYWDLLWRAGLPPTADAAQAPWRVLAGAYTPQRAAWIATTMTPVNIAEQPATPTPDGEQPTPPPSYPTPPGRASSYEQAPAASALPDAWTVFLYRGDQVTAYSGAPIPASLPVGLTPHDGTLPDGLPVDAGMRWLVDFDEAVSVGMGLTIPLAPDDLRAGFDRIIVLGVRGGKADGPGNAQFAALLDAHHYTDGVAFVPQGTPTNNTPDAAAGYSRKDPDYAISFAVERSAPLTGDATADGPVAAGLLGLPTAVFDHVQYADGHGAVNGRAMLTALWPATLGYAMDQMFAPVFSAQAIDQARSYALASAIPRGTLPALRAGTTPYGLLPVTSLADYADPPPSTSPPSLLVPPDPEAALVVFLKPLLAIWAASTAGAPHVGGSADPDQDLLQVLGMDASSMDFRARQVIGDEAMWNLLRFIGVPLDEWWPEHLARGRALLDSVGLTGWDPRVIHTSMGRDSHPVPYSTVQDGPLSEQATLTADASVGGTLVNYITWIRNASIGDLQNESYPGPATPTSVLYRVLRQSMLREYVSLAGLAQVSNGTLHPDALREAELVNIRQATVSITPWDILARPVATGSAVNWGQYLHELDPPPGSPFARLAELRASLDMLAALPTAELDRLLTETLDACSHRIDVWVSAIANSILARRRAAQPAAGAPTLHLGGYGWVENVRPAPVTVQVSGADAAAVTRLDESRRQVLPEQDWAALRPVQQPASDNGGFVHAPSMTQAAAGAVLRSGYLTHRATPDEQVLAIDVSSDRTRSALWLLDGVREGQSLGALTGYQFEEALHEAGLDVYIQPFRDKYPLIGDELTPTSPASTDVTPSQVVDGVKLREGWQAGELTAGTVWGAGLPAPAPPANDTQNAVLGYVASLDDLLDGLGDLSLAESVYQIMRGNFGRSGGMLDAVSRGDHPPVPDLADTPQAGLDVAHRLMLLFAGAPSAAPEWGGVTTRPRAAAEPWLDAWLGGLLPAPDTVRCIVSWTAGGALQHVTVSLRDLDIGPLDVLALADAADRPQRSELENRIAYAAGPPAGAQTVTISYDTAGLPADTVGFPDLLTVAGALRDLLNAATPLGPQDFALPETDASAAGGATDAGELSTRAVALVQRLTDDIAELTAAIGGLPAAPQPTRDALLTAAGYGVTGSVPVADGNVSDLTTQATTVLAELRQRLAAAQQTALPTADPSAAAGVITAILGTAVLALPRLTPPDAATLQTGFGQSAAMRAVDPTALDRWLLQLSHMRPAAERLDYALSAAQLLGAPPPGPLDLAQLPVTGGDRWLGLPLDPSQPPAQGRVAIEAVAVGDPASQAPLAGLLLDQWLERIPSPTVTAGVSFHYEEPKARAPQAMLLAVCPDSRELWDITLLRTIVEETLALAKARAVDLASITEAGQILPALYFPFNLAGATAGTHFVAVEEGHAVTSFGAGADSSAG
jgi:hypothetical protein